MLHYWLRAKSQLMHAGMLLALCLPYCINLGKSSIWDANEAFYSETPREMLQTGDYLAPQFNFQTRAQKPPFTYWAVLLSFRLFGVGEFAVRLPGMLAAIGVVLLSYRIARSLFNSRTALWAAAITAMTPRVFILARRLPIDILLLFFLTATFFFLVRALKNSTTSDWVLGYLTAALGFLTKGPIAVFLPAAACLGWALYSRRARFSASQQLFGFSVFLIIVMPWYLLVYRLHGWVYIAPFFLRDNLGRYAAESMGPSRGPFYYFSVFAIDFFPWSLLGFFAAYRIWEGRKSVPPLKQLAYGFPIIWCAITFVLFSFSRNKQEYYIAPLYPLAAIVIAGILDSVLSQRSMPPGDNSAPRDSGSALIGPYLIISILFLLLSAVLPYPIHRFMPDVPAVLHYCPSIVFGGGFVLLVYGMITKRFLHCFWAVSIPIWITYVICVTYYLPAIEALRPVKSLCRTIESQIMRESEAGYFGTALPSMVFYLRRPVFEETDPERMAHRFQSQRQVFCLLSARDYEYFIKNRGIKLCVLDRRPRFAPKLGDLIHAPETSRQELLLVSNRACSENKPGPSL
jgi:4-amino-4-deoxy-L-arabinose transferase-like glycosyltransferase